MKTQMKRWYYLYNQLVRNEAVGIKAVNNRTETT